MSVIWDPMGTEEINMDYYCEHACDTHTHSDLESRLRGPELERKGINIGIIVVRLCIYSMFIL